MSKVKPQEFEDRPAIAEPDPGDSLPLGIRYSLAFKVASCVAGVFAIAPGLLFPVINDDALSSAWSRGVGAFSILIYAYLQTACVWQQLHSPQTRRARVYFWLLASLPLWGIPVGHALTAIIIQIGFYMVRST